MLCSRVDDTSLLCIQQQCFNHLQWCCVVISNEKHCHTSVPLSAVDVSHSAEQTSESDADIPESADQLVVFFAEASDPMQGSQDTFRLVQICTPEPCKLVLTLTACHLCERPVMTMISSICSPKLLGADQ